MNFRVLFSVVLVCFSLSTFAQTQSISTRIDSLISAPAQQPFNGIILLAKGGKILYNKPFGYANLEQKTPFKPNDQFVIGSISKQFTAVLLLQEYEKGRVQLHVPIRTYLPELPQSWADTVTVHHLLTHMHGITSLTEPTQFTPGTQYSYSQIGYDLLARIVEKTSGMSFAESSGALFKRCGMKHTFHPDGHYTQLVKGYTETEPGRMEFDSSSLENYPAAGAFISTASDLLTWNLHLQNGKLLKKSTFELMNTKQKNAIRNHPIFGPTDYGYGVTVDTKDRILQTGQTGFAPGFVSMDFYYPATKISIIVLENVAYDTDHFKHTFFYHTELLKILRSSTLIRKF